MSEARVLVRDVVKKGDVGHQSWAAEVNDYLEDATLIDLGIGKERELAVREEIV
jgi:hypothetical protein